MVKANLNISEKFIHSICERLEENKQVRRSLPNWGRLHIDRQLPFLCVYRKANEFDNSRSQRLIMGEASYLTASGNRLLQKQISLLVNNVAVTLKKIFGSFLIIEIWMSTDDEGYSNLEPYQPAFKIIRHKKTKINSTIESLDKYLKKVSIRKQPADVEIITLPKIKPHNLPPLISKEDEEKIGCHYLGIKVRTIHQDLDNDVMYPLILRNLQRAFSKALTRSFFQFTRINTTHKPIHYQSLGRRCMVKAVWEVDRQLAEISNSFDFLLQVSPVNPKKAWSSFQKNNYEKKPEFLYRPLPIEPSLEKRKLYQIPIERIEDPSIAQLFREQQLELDRMLTMLIDRNTPRFLFGSLQLYGNVDDKLMKTSEELLKHLSPRSRDESLKNSVNANTFAKRANLEIESYRKKIPECKSKVIIRDDVTGLMVSKGNLLIGKDLKISENRMEALIQHEVGTHVLTYLNGMSQPLKQLYIGLAGYEELQEGLAVLSEYLVGGLTQPRLRLLAIRVLAAYRMIHGASFQEVFHEINKIYCFELQTAFTITMRIFRSGGLTKDAVYLRGLVKLLSYLKKGGELDPLFIGKISADHIGMVKELQLRKVLKKAPLQPSYIKNPETRNKLDELKNDVNLINLLKRS